MLVSVCTHLAEFPDSIRLIFSDHQVQGFGIYKHETFKAGRALRVIQLQKSLCMPAI